LLVINQAVGDAVSDMLLSLISMQILNMTIDDWHNMYTDYPSRQTKVPVTNKDLITCSSDEMMVLQPAALQRELDEVSYTTPAPALYRLLVIIDPLCNRLWRPHHKAGASYVHLALKITCVCMRRLLISTVQTSSRELVSVPSTIT
jgi:hypothetical protein